MAFSKTAFCGLVLSFVFVLLPNSILSKINHDDDFTCPDGTGFYPHPEYCEMYYGCFNYVPTLAKCSALLLFDIKYGGCNWPESTDCQNITRLDSYPNTRTPPPSGAWEPSTVKPIDCPPIWEDKLYPDPSNCSSYYRCVHGRSFHYKCAPPTLFNDQYRHCEHEGDVDCGNRPK